MDEARDVIADHHKRIRALEAVRNNPLDREGRWKVFDAIAANSGLGTPKWSGNVRWYPWDACGDRVGGMQCGYSASNPRGRDQGVWTNAYDGSDTQRNIVPIIAGTSVDWFSGWMRDGRVLVNKAVPNQVVAMDRDGAGPSIIADIIAAPYSGDAGKFTVRGYPIQAEQQGIESRVLVRSFGTAEIDRIVGLSGTVYTAYTATFAHGVTGTQYEELFGEYNLLDFSKYNSIYALQSNWAPSLGGGQQIDLFDESATLIYSLYGSGGAKTFTSFTEFMGPMVQFSPDGRWIAWNPATDGAGGSSGLRELWVMDLEAAVLTPVDLTGGVNWESFCWSPDSDKLIAVNLDDKNLWALAINTQAASNYRLQITSDGTASGTVRYRQPQWAGCSLISRRDDASIADPLAELIDLNPSTGSYTVLDSQGYGGQTDVFGYPGGRLSRDGNYVCYAKPASPSGDVYGDDYLDANGNYMFDVLVITTVGNACVC